MKTETDQSATTYYVAPITASDSSGIQTCDYLFISQGSWHSATGRLDSSPSSVINFVQLDPQRLPLPNPPLTGTIDSTAVLFAAVVHTIGGMDPPPQTLFQASARSILQVPVDRNFPRGLILVFAVPGGLRPTKDPQITNSGPGTQ